MSEYSQKKINTAALVGDSIVDGPGLRAVVFVQECPLESLERKLAAQTGFRITGHSLSFTGICPACQKKQSKP